MRINSVNSNYMSAQEAKSSNLVNNNGNIEVGANNVNDQGRTDISVDKVINDSMLENSVKQANKALEQFNRVLERTVHETTHTIMYVLKDTLTNEIIEEFPPRKIQDMIAKMWEMAGLIVDERR